MGHIIDTVLIPQSLETTTEAIAANPNSNIVELAQRFSDLSTLVTALAAANLVSALEGAGPFTVFAPSNAAFGKIPSAELGRMLEPENVKELAGILKYHVVSGAAVYSKDLQAAQDVETLQGQVVSITSSADGVIINGNSKVILADNAATNGVVHIVDTVLMPPKPTTTAATTTQPPTDAIVRATDGGRMPVLTCIVVIISIMT